MWNSGIKASCSIKLSTRWGKEYLNMVNEEYWHPVVLKLSTSWGKKVLEYGNEESLNPSQLEAI